MNTNTLFDFIPTKLIEAYDARMDFDGLSIPNIMKTFPSIDYTTASCISLASKRQILRDRIKKDLQDYFSNTYI